MVARAPKSTLADFCRMLSDNRQLVTKVSKIDSSRRVRHFIAIWRGRRVQSNEEIKTMNPKQLSNVPFQLAHQTNNNTSKQKPLGRQDKF